MRGKKVSLAENSGCVSCRIRSDNENVAPADPDEIDTAASVQSLQDLLRSHIQRDGRGLERQLFRHSGVDLCAIKQE